MPMMMTVMIETAAQKWVMKYIKTGQRASNSNARIQLVIAASDGRPELAVCYALCGVLCR